MSSVTQNVISQTPSVGMSQPVTASSLHSGYKHRSTKAVDYLNGDKAADIKILCFNGADTDLWEAYKAWVDRQSIKMIEPSIVDGKLSIGEMD